MSRPQHIPPRRKDASSEGRAKWWALGSFLAFWLWRRWRSGSEARSPIRRESAVRGHEPETGTNVGGIIAFGIGLLMMTGVVLALMVALFGWFAERSAPEGPPAPFAGYEAVPPSPLLQRDPAIDLQELHQRENELLYGYAWADRPAGIVRIPIDRAMALIAERGLPTRDPSTFADTLLAPTESGFGLVRRTPPPPTAPPYLGSSIEPYTPAHDLRRVLNEMRHLRRDSLR